MLKPSSSAVPSTQKNCDTKAPHRRQVDTSFVARDFPIMTAVLSEFLTTQLDCIHVVNAVSLGEVGMQKIS